MPTPAGRLTSDAYRSGVARLLGYGLSLVAAIVIARSLGTSGKGILSVATALPGMVALLAGLGLGTAATVAIREGWLPRGPSLRGLAAYTAVVSLLSLAVPLVWARTTEDSLQTSMYGAAAAISVGGLLLTEYAAGLLQGRREGVRQGMWFRQAIGIGQSLTVVLLLLLGVRNPLTILVAFAAWSWACGLAAFGLMFRSAWDPAPSSAVPWTSRLLRVGVRTQAIWILLLLNYRLDVGLLATLSSVEQVGVYSVAVGFSEFAWLGVNALAGVLLPHLSGIDAAASVSRTARAVRAAVCVTSCLAVAAFVGLQAFASQVFGPGFADAGIAFGLLAPGLVTLSAFKVLAIYGIATGQTRVPTALAAVGLGLNVLLNVVLIPPLGAPGASISSSVSYTLISVLAISWFARNAGVRVLYVLGPSRSDLAGAVSRLTR